MPKILVTGANGFVGRHVVEKLLDYQFQVDGIGGSQLDQPGRQAGETYSYSVLDLTKPQEAEQVDYAAVQGIIHLAGLAAVGPSFEAPLDYMMVNVGIEINLFEAAIKQNARPRFLIVSSGSLYDPAADLPITEASPLLPSSPYAVSKLGQEDMARYYSARGFEVITARPFNHIGPGQGPGFIVPDLVEQIINVERGKQTELRVGNLESKRDYTDVRDVARAYMLLLKQGRPGETYNICSGAARSGQEILDALLTLSSGSTPTVTTDPGKMRPADNPIIYGSYQKIATDTGWRPEIELQQTLADILADWRSH